MFMSVSDENKKFYKRLSFLALPIIGQELINSLVNILDTFMIGSLGVHEITAVGLSNQLFFLFMLLCFGVNSGSSVLMGQYWGNSDTKSLRKTLGVCMVLSLLAAFIFSIFALFFPAAVMRIYSMDEKVIEVGASYLRIVWVSYFLCAVVMSVNSSLKSIGETRIPFITTFIALLCNAVLNYIFIFILKKGVEGAAYATVIARTIELIVQQIVIRIYRMPVRKFVKETFEINKEFLKSYFKITLPVIINEFVWALGTSMYQVAYQFCGTEAQGAIQITSSIQNLFQVVGMSIGAATGIMLANLLGSGEVETAIKYSRKLLVTSIVLSIIMSVGLLVFSPYIVNIFNVSDEVKAHAYNIMFVISISMVIKTFNYTTIVGILRSGGDTLFCVILDTIAVWAIGVPAAFLGAYVLQIPVHLVIAMVNLEEVFKLFVSGKRTLSNKWANTLV